MLIAKAKAAVEENFAALEKRYEKVVKNGKKPIKIWRN